MNILSQIPKDRDSVVVTLVDCRGSVPQNLGAKVLVTTEGLAAGTVGGGKVEAKAIETALKILADKESRVCQLIEWNLTTDVGMTCGGVVKFLFELQRPDSWKIVVFGAGHVAQELVPMLCKLQAQVVCVESRQEWLGKLADAENLEKRLVTIMASAVSAFSDEDFYVLMTQGHSTDLPVITEILRTKRPRYLGVIGSETKALKLRAHLQQSDFNKETIDRIHCPIGLPVGNNSPVEIAFSVVAQLLQERDRKRN